MFPFHPRTNKFAQGKFSVIMKAVSPTYLEEWGEERSEFVGPCLHRDRDYCIGSNF
jgi:hypothetical protein